MISLITPNYNGEKYLDDYLSSIAEQTLPQDEIEVIFVDDGSTDSSRSIVSNYQKEIPGLRSIWHEHIGSPSTLRNVALDHAMGKYVLFLDSDDFLGAEALERLDEFSNENPSDIFAFQLEGIDRNVPKSMLSKTLPYADIVDSGLYKSMGIWKMVSKNFLDKHDIRFDTSVYRGEDILFFLEAMLKAETTSILADYPFYKLRGREDGSSITQAEWDPAKHLDLTTRAARLIIELARNDSIRDHFMIRQFNTEALDISSTSSVTPELIESLRKELQPYWTQSVAELIYTDENRNKLIQIFGEPHD